MIKKLIFCALALSPIEAFANPAPAIAGTWQGPCEVRDIRAVEFTYVISEPDENGDGTIAKTKVYWDDTACTVYNHTGRKNVPYHLGEPVDGVYPIDVAYREVTFFDIVVVSEDESTLYFGEKHARDDVSARPTALSTTKRVFLRVED